MLMFKETSLYHQLAVSSASAKEVHASAALKISASSAHGPAFSSERDLHSPRTYHIDLFMSQLNIDCATGASGNSFPRPPFGEAGAAYTLPIWGRA